MINHDESPSLKNWNQPFEIKPFCTEWDHWCQHRLTVIDQKFGPMPYMDPMMRRGWWQWNQQVVNETLQKHSVVRLQYGALNEHIHRLFDSCARAGEPRIIVSDTQIPHTPPDNVRVIATEPTAYQFSRTFADSDIKPVYHRQAKDLRHPFLIMTRGQDHGRPRLMLMLEQLGLLKDALYSVGDINAQDYYFSPDTVSINSTLENMSTQIVGDKYIKFDVKKNLKILPALINLCHFYVGVDTNGLFSERLLWSVGEKTLWGYTTTVPVLPIWYDSIAHQMGEWGYRFTNIPYRRSGETVQDTVIRWCREILFHYQIAQNQQWSQSWQDSQGETTIHNFELTRRLHQIIWESIERQIAELPQEFQNIQ